MTKSNNPYTQPSSPVLKFFNRNDFISRKGAKDAKKKDSPKEPEKKELCVLCERVKPFFLSFLLLRVLGALTGLPQVDFFYIGGAEII